AFDLCRVGDSGFSFSHSSLTSRETRTELWSLAKTHPTLHTHLTDRHSNVSPATSFTTPIEDSTVNSLNSQEFDIEDDADVSQAALVASITALATRTNVDLSAHGVHLVDGRVESDDKIPVYETHEDSTDVSSTRLVETQAVPESTATEELGRGKQRRIPNPQYSGSFWVAH
ncbi:hypothetical protein FRC01_001650, partial [Tulasnella sp. 417]